MKRIKLSFATCCISLLLQSGSLSAGEWHSSDGAIAVATPDLSRFSALKPSPPILARWGSQDEKINLLIKKKSVQPGLKFSQSDLEEGLISEINLTMKKGRLLVSTMKKHEGYNLLTMTAQGENGNMTIYFTHKIIATSETQYIAVAVGIGTDTRTNPDTAAFIDSFRDLTSKPIVQARTTVPSSPEKVPSSPENLPSSPERTETIKYEHSDEAAAKDLGFKIGNQIGYFGSCLCCLAVPLGIIWLLSKVLSGNTR